MLRKWAPLFVILITAFLAAIKAQGSETRFLKVVNHTNEDLHVYYRTDSWGGLSWSRPRRQFIPRGFYGDIAPGCKTRVDDELEIFAVPAAADPYGYGYFGGSEGAHSYATRCLSGTGYGIGNYAIRCGYGHGGGYPDSYYGHSSRYPYYDYGIDAGRTCSESGVGDLFGWGGVPWESLGGSSSFSRRWERFKHETVRVPAQTQPNLPVSISDEGVNIVFHFQ
jgi:hypothetical protein